MTGLPTVTDLYNAVKAVSEESPDRVSPACRYFDVGGSCLCMVGEGLGRIGITSCDLGVGLDYATDFNGSNVDTVVAELVANGKMEGTSSNSKMEVLLKAQAYQDGRHTGGAGRLAWGAAWVRAHEYVEMEVE